MSAEKDYAPLSTACVRALNDKLYDKRKAAALEIEKMVKDFVVRKDMSQVKKILRILGQDFALSQSPHARKGGLIGLAAVAIALGKDTAHYIPDLISPILVCFSDSDIKVRYCACESLYNVVKVARGATLDYFTDIFDGLSNLATDPDQGVKNGSETLDRLMKDIVTESSSFDLISFMPMLRERITTKNDFARQFIISWVSVLDTVPQIDMVLVLPDILDGLFKILEDQRTEIKTVCATLLSEFLRSIKQNPCRVDFQGMINILALHAQSQDDLLQFTALTWIKEFVQLSDKAMLPYTSAILTATLPCLSYEIDSKRNIKETAKAVNFSLMKLFTQDIECDSKVDISSIIEVLMKFLLQTKVPTKVAVLKWILHLHMKMPNRMFEHIEKLFLVLLKVLSDSSDEVVQQDMEVLAEVISYQQGTSEESEPIQRNDSTNKYFPEFIDNLLRLFSTDRRLLEERGSFIIRQLCTLLNAEVIYKALSEALLRENNLRFISTMVDYLNIILLTSSELFELRNKLKDLSTKESWKLFESLYYCWCHNPVATVALCLLSQNYAHACDLIHLRLELLDVPCNQHLVQALYGLLMLLPQTEAFHTLRQRLDCIPSLHLYEFGKQTKGTADKYPGNQFDFPLFLDHFINIQEQHKKERLLSRASNLKEKCLKNV
ncbi:hypothetical protein RUM43_005244 [Polyplax serrata]|uniref:Protein VAC14 homolog n=1 Tax=Polyplax serrata TaxID=468196 RepID=A0AAN8XMT4_POLSC